MNSYILSIFLSGFSYIKDFLLKKENFTECLCNICKLLCLLPTVISKDNLSIIQSKLIKKDNYLESVVFNPFSP